MILKEIKSFLLHCGPSENTPTLGRKLMQQALIHLHSDIISLLAFSVLQQDSWLFFLSCMCLFLQSPWESCWQSKSGLLVWRRRNAKGTLILDPSSAALNDPIVCFTILAITVSILPFKFLPPLLDYRFRLFSALS